MLFTDLESAFEEAQFLANEMRGCGQRRSAYLTQAATGWSVTGSKPKAHIAMTVKPRPRTTKQVGVTYIATRKYRSKWRATYYHAADNVKFLGWHSEQGQALAAVTRYKDMINA